MEGTLEFLLGLGEILVGFGDLVGHVAADGGITGSQPLPEPPIPKEPIYDLPGGVPGTGAHRG